MSDLSDKLVKASADVIPPAVDCYLPTWPNGHDEPPEWVPVEDVARAAAVAVLREISHWEGNAAGNMHLLIPRLAREIEEAGNE